MIPSDTFTIETTRQLFLNYHVLVSSEDNKEKMQVVAEKKNRFREGLVVRYDKLNPYFFQGISYIILLSEIRFGSTERQKDRMYYQNSQKPNLGSDLYLMETRRGRAIPRTERNDSTKYCQSQKADKNLSPRWSADPFTSLFAPVRPVSRPIVSQLEEMAQREGKKEAT